MLKPTKGGFYAVRQGRTTGVFLTWDECEAQIKGYSAPQFKKFMNAADAENFVNGSTTAGPSTNNTSTGQSSNNAGNTSAGEKGKKRAMSPNVEDESGWDVVYSDGACKRNGKAGSVAGVGVWWGPDDPRNIAERCPGDQTNNRAELIAILRILETTPQTKKPLLIKTDSQYSINCFKFWLPGWRRNGWRTAGGTPVKNVGIIRYLSAHLDARARFGQKIRLQYVKGHSGETGNDGADAQANLGALSSTEPERDWRKLEKELAKRVEEEWRGQLDKPSTVPMEVEGDPVEQSTESPMKVRKTGRELTSQQFPRATSKSLSSALPVLPTIPNKQPPDLSLPRRAGSLRQISSFKAAEVASPSPPKREIPRATSKLADPPSPAILASTAKQTSPIKQMTDASRRSPSPSKYPQKTQVRTPKTPSRISHPGTPGKLLRDPVPLVNPSAAGLTASTLRNKTKGSIAEGPKTPNRTTKTVQVQTTPTPIAEIEPAVRIPDTLGIPPIVVNKEDIDFTMFEDCAIDDEDMWKDLWP